MTGCHAIDFYTPALESPVPPELEPPRELSKVSLPTYRIEPPDVIQLEVLRLVPRPSYRIDTYDVLQIRVMGVLLQQPIDDFFLVEGDGIVTLGAGLRSGPGGRNDDGRGRRGDLAGLADFLLRIRR